MATPSKDPKILTPHALQDIARAARDYSRPLIAPRRIIRRLLAHIGATEPGKDKQK